MTSIQYPETQLPVSSGTQNLADILERILDKGIVIAGDIQINLLDIELLTIKLRLLVASVDKAQEIGIDWWSADPYLSGDARALEDRNRSLNERVQRLEQLLETSSDESLERQPGNGPAREEQRS